MWTEEDIKEAPVLPWPYNVLFLDSGESIAFAPVSWGLYRIRVPPDWGRMDVGRLILVLRVSVDERTPVPFAYFLDIDAAHLISVMVPHLDRWCRERTILKITRYEEIPRSYYKVEEVGRLR